LKTHVADYLQRDRSVLGIHWTSHFEDWLPINFEKAVRLVPEAVEPGGILLLHDGSPSSEEYRDRSPVLTLTEMIAAECQRRSIPLAGLASVFPTLHRIRSESERLREDNRVSVGSIMVDSIATTISLIKHWCGSI
jgi:hypothetical protein